MTPERYAFLRGILDRRQPDLTVALEGVHKPHNLAAIARSADAVGVMQVHAITAAPAMRLTQEAAAGIGKYMTVACHTQVEEAVETLHRSGHHVVAADVGDGTVDYREVDYTRPIALLMGAERPGLSDTARQLADQRLTIPMRGVAESLNVSVAAALLLFEARRQREAAGLYDTPRIDPDTYRTLLFEWSYPRVAAQLRARGRPYPALDDEGYLIRDHSTPEDRRVTKLKRPARGASGPRRLG